MVLIIKIIGIFLDGKRFSYSSQLQSKKEKAM